MQGFSQSTEANYIVSLRCTDGSHNLFFRGYSTSNGKKMVKYTSEISEAFRMTFENAKMRAESFNRVRGRVESVDYENNRTVVA